jgi:hypothetical protein
MAMAMMPPGSYEQMCRDLEASFRDQGSIPLQPRRSARLVGLLFARPRTPFAAAEIVPSLRYFHQRSGHSINFYCAGFEVGWDLAATPDTDILTAYSDTEFDAFRRDIETRCKWRYSGGADLLLANARFDGWEVAIDFSSMISANLVKMKSDGAIDSVDSFFERIFQYSETQDGTDPTWGFSDSSARSLIPSALKNLLISFLPEGLRADSKKAFHFVVSDLSL